MATEPVIHVGYPYRDAGGLYARAQRRWATGARQSFRTRITLPAPEFRWGALSPISLHKFPQYPAVLSTLWHMGELYGTPPLTRAIVGVMIGYVWMQWGEYWEGLAPCGGHWHHEIRVDINGANATVTIKLQMWAPGGNPQIMPTPVYWQYTSPSVPWERPLSGSGTMAWHPGPLCDNGGTPTYDGTFYICDAQDGTVDWWIDDIPTTMQQA